MSLVKKKKKRKPYLETSVVSSANEKEETGRLEEPQVFSTTDKVSQFGKVAEITTTKKYESKKSEISLNTLVSRKPFAVKVPLNLDTIMSHIRRKNQNQKAKTHVHVRRKELLHGTLKAMRGPDFNFRKTPVILFTGDDTEDDREEPIKEFFRS